MDVAQENRTPAVSIRRVSADDYEEIASLSSAAGLTFCGEGRDAEEPFRRQLVGRAPPDC